jgi:hypothetical protein
MFFYINHLKNNIIRCLFFLSLNLNLNLDLNLKNIVLSSVSIYLTKSIFYHIFAGYENFDISHL